MKVNDIETNHIRVDVGTGHNNKATEEEKNAIQELRSMMTTEFLKRFDAKMYGQVVDTVKQKYTFIYEFKSRQDIMKAVHHLKTKIKSPYIQSVTRVKPRG